MIFAQKYPYYNMGIWHCNEGSQKVLADDKGNILNHVLNREFDIAPEKKAILIAVFLFLQENIWCGYSLEGSQLCWTISAYNWKYSVRAEFSPYSLWYENSVNDLYISVFHQ